MTKMSDLRKLLWDRSGGLCEVTGYPLGGGPDGPWEAHHRRPKGMGGTTREHKDCMCNLIAVQPRVHNLDPNSIHGWPQRSYDHGWLIRKYVDEPGEVPLWWRDRAWVVLDCKGWMLVPRRDQLADLPSRPMGWSATRDR